MTFVEAFKQAIQGKRIRREWWHHSAYLTVNESYHLVCWPDMRHWAGPYEPCLEDVEAVDWVAEDMP